MTGAAFPLFAIIFGGAFDAFIMPYYEVLPNTHKWAALFPILGLMAGVGTFLKVSTMNSHHNLHHIFQNLISLQRKYFYPKSF